MNRLAKWALRLYPSRWRARYGDELNALLSDTGADAGVVADLLRGGIRMQFSAWPFLKLALVLGIAGALLGTGFGLLLPSQYMSMATLRVSPAQIGAHEPGTLLTPRLNELIQQLEIQFFSRTSLAAIINSPQLQLYADDLRTKPMEDVIEEMKKNISIQFVSLPGALGSGSSAFNIRFTYPDRLKAQKTVQAIIGSFLSENLKRSFQPAFLPKTGGLMILDQASLPTSPFYPFFQMFMLAGFAIGVLIASIWRLIHRTGFIARRFALVAVAFGITGLAVVIVADRLDVLPYKYRSVATLRLRGGNRQQFLALGTAALSRMSLGTIITDPRMMLYKDQFKTMVFEDVIQEMRKHLTITQIGNRNGTIFTVSFEYQDRFKAQQTVSTIVDKLIDTYQRFYPNAAPDPPFRPVVMDVLDTASLPLTPVKPNRRMLALTGGVAGLTIASIIAIIRRRWKPEAGIPVDTVHG